MDTNFDKVIADLHNLREDVREVNEDYELELEIYRTDLGHQFGVKLLLVLSMFINGILVVYCARDDGTTITGPRLS